MLVDALSVHRRANGTDRTPTQLTAMTYYVALIESRIKDENPNGARFLQYARQDEQEDWLLARRAGSTLLRLQRCRRRNHFYLAAGRRSAACSQEQPSIDSQQIVADR